MTTEQIDLKIVKQLIDEARNLKAQLKLTREQLDSVSREKQTLTEDVQNKVADFSRRQEAEKMQHIHAIQAVKDESQQKIAELIKANEVEIQSTTSEYEEKLSNVTEELTQKNNNLLKELQKTQKSHQAVINRIRGIES